MKIKMIQRKQLNNSLRIIKIRKKTRKIKAVKLLKMEINNSKINKKLKKINDIFYINLKAIKYCYII